MKDEYDFDYSKAWIPIAKCNPPTDDLVYVTMIGEDKNRYVAEGVYDKNSDRWSLEIESPEDKIIAWKIHEPRKPHYYMGFFDDKI